VVAHQLQLQRTVRSHAVYTFLRPTRQRQKPNHSAISGTSSFPARKGKSVTASLHRRGGEGMTEYNPRKILVPIEMVSEIRPAAADHIG
jgi:hypothetical protein